MLDPRDHAFLSLAVTRGLVPEPRARELAQRYRGMPGGLAGALVDLGLITAEARRRLEAELASAELRVPGFATTVATDEVIATPSSSSGLERGAPPPAPGFRTTVGTDEVIATPPSGGLFESDAPPRPGLRTTVATDEVIATPPSAGVLESDEPVRPAGTQQTSILAGLLGPRVHLPGYELEAELGRGGMGIVHRARRLATGERVAIKLLLDVSPRHRQRFRREAAALERLSHPHVIGVLETGEAPDGQPYIIMPFAPGGDLRQAIARGLEPRKALEILAKVARAIAHAHDESVVHRDLKPGNVLLDEALEPKVTDFGLARILDHESQLTRTGVALGTPQYMAPEQVRCADPG
ncbi:MAG: serine/threonine protein kinase, partial [Planctomycetota bacterium]|nr:serine/threonine protein kinase [Planctomycetota bacterium]